MAQYRQSGMERSGVLRGQDIRNGNSNSNNNNKNNSDAASSSFDHVSIGINNHNHHKQTRTTRRPLRVKSRQISFCAIALVLALVLSLSLLAVSLLSGYQKEVTKHTSHSQNDEMKSDFRHLIENVTQTTETSSKVLRFGHGSIAYGRDSRYWDKDDRRRDEDYSEDVLKHTGMLAGGDSKGKSQDSKSKTASKTFSNHPSFKILNRPGVELYHETGRDELKLYEAEYQASLNYDGRSREKNGDVEFGRQHAEADVDDEYDDGLDSHDAQMEDYENRLFGHAEHYDLSDGHIKDATDPGIKSKEGVFSSREDLSLNSQNSKNTNMNSRHVSGVDGQSTRRSNPEKRVEPKKKSKRRKFSGSSCEMKLLNSTSQLVEPLESRKFARFSLKYVEVEEIPEGEEHWEPRFAGHQSLQERKKSFLVNDKIINCGFVNGPKGLPSTGFDLAEDDARYISNCHIAVSSCIFGNSDRLRSPTSKMVTRVSRKNVCFVMFMDEITLQTLSLEGQTPDRMGFIGFWKVVVVKNLPYDDMRRVGKIPKLLPHRLFSSARYSIWLDSKLRLQLDPLLILEYFLWRKGYEYAISNHYDRHCLWEEVAQNKKLNKYNHTVIDHQFAFYQADGLKRFNASDPNKLLPSNVPEGSFIVRAHTPMSNLFSCLWFNEVDRFTPRDQLSFAYTYQKFRRMNPDKVFRLNMFKDCERRAIAKLFHHRSDEKRKFPR